MIARQLLIDPDYPNKVIQGRESEIVWKNPKDNAIFRSLMTNVPIWSKQNPELGHEHPSAVLPTRGRSCSSGRRETAS